MIKRLFIERARSIKPLNALPTFLTFANACLGLISIIQSLEDNYMWAAYCIFFAAILDGCDGCLARKLGVESLLGSELDSLSDAISFVLAPAILLYSWTVSDFGILGVAILALYLCAGLFRLARFNIESNQEKNVFIGLPTPVAAFFVTSFIVYQEWLEASRAYFIFHKLWMIILIVLIAYLMISSIKFPSFKGNRGAGRFSLYKIFMYLFPVGLLGIVFGYPIFLFMQLWYIFYSIGTTALSRFNSKNN